MNEKRADESPYELDRIRELLNRVQKLVVEVEIRENTIQQADQDLNELNKLRDLINRVQQSIFEVETQANKIEWLRLYFALYFLQSGKSFDPSVKDFKKSMDWEE
jgi:CRISPR/Cas system-associated endoribonuclease Cas2